MNSKLYCINPNTKEYEEVKTICGINIEEILDLIKDYKMSKDLKFDKFGKLEEIQRLKEEYIILQNASDKVEEEKDREIERLKRLANKDYTELNILELKKFDYERRINKAIHRIQLIQMDGEVTIRDLTELVNILKGVDKE